MTVEQIKAEKVGEKRYKTKTIVLDSGKAFHIIAKE